LKIKDINYLSNGDTVSPISLMKLSVANIFLKWFETQKSTRRFWLEEIIDTKELE